MPRNIKISLVVVAVVFVLSLGSFVDILDRVRSMVRPEARERDTQFAAPRDPLYAPTDPPIGVTLFFPSSGSGPLLTAVPSRIFKSADPANRARQILAQLAETARPENVLAALPPDARVQHIFISDEGTAFVDFNNSIAVNHSGGVRGEQATIFSVVNSLTYNMPEIRQVKILVGGTEKETLAGHCLLLFPFERDLGLTNIEEDKVTR